ncbi:VCBS repeat-containing protein [Ktedonosporobacter rubrisoli]|uniref:VCBS repeat-containing protein n=1 Tax=Ktedonosporobacter rubrisoli TaxID=2509675 RepID=A0A4P6K4J8_KTERU|nr:VCBS repeat-containing protein [Ktedonosporobacter rubrisoli]QBD82456.1 VCBS repeat-containing protein [Ktedonosporobacter rubrisoli]
MREQQGITSSTFIPRASRVTEERASMHHAGFTSGIHPESDPYTTDEQYVHSHHGRKKGHYDLYIQPLPTSTRRYRSTTQHKTLPRVRGFYALLIGGSIMAGALIATLVPPLFQRISDQLTYGYPRSYQTDSNVGHYEHAKDPRSHFVAINNHGYIEVVELPEGVPDKDAVPQLYLIALPDNHQADLAPVTITFEDINGDGKPDMVVSCNNTTFVYYNNGTTFKQKL